jgi:hypothetical protein
MNQMVASVSLLFVSARMQFSSVSVECCSKMFELKADEFQSFPFLLHPPNGIFQSKVEKQWW